MVADQHRLADNEVLAYRAGRVGQHDDARPGRAGRPHRMDDVLQIVAFVGVHAAGQHQHLARTDADRQHPAGMAG